MSLNPLSAPKEQDLYEQDLPVKHCRSCFRNDLHVNVDWHPFIYGLILVATLGLIYFMRPSRCICCGTARIF